MQNNMNIIVKTNNVFRNERAKYHFSSLDRAIHMINTPHFGVEMTMFVNGIMMPDTDDDAFFYGSVKAAEDGKVWCEEHHSFHTPEWVGELRGGCFDTDDNEDAAQFWAEAITNVRKDIDGTNPVTGGEDEAIVRDFDLVEALNHEKDLMVELVGNLDDVDVDGNPMYYWRVTKCDKHDDEGTVNDETPTMSEFELDIQFAVMAMAKNNFEMVMPPTYGSLPFIGYFTDDCRDEGGEIKVECRFFVTGETEGDVITFKTADSDYYEVSAKDFLGWKSVRG